MIEEVPTFFVSFFGVGNEARDSKELAAPLFGGDGAADTL